MVNQRNQTQRNSQLAVGTQPVKVGYIPAGACEGSMNFLKVSTGNTIYIEVQGLKPSVQQHYTRLDDVGTLAGPEASEDGIIPGEIWAVCTDASGILDFSASYRITQGGGQ